MSKKRKIDHNFYSVFRSVAEDYICLFDVDITTGKEIMYSFEDEQYELPNWGEAEDFAVRIASFTNNLVVPEDRERFANDTRIERLVPLLRTQKEYIIEYSVNLDGLIRRFQGRFLLGKTEETKNHLYIGIRDITDVKDIEERSRELAEYERYKQILKVDTVNKRTILVVDDNEINREIIRTILSDRYYVLEAENGAEGYYVLEKQYRRISLILLDLQMPVMNGLEFLEKAQADSLYSQIPIIVMTSDTKNGEETRCFSMGASDFVSKPYNPKVVRSRVDSIIRLNESAATLAAVEFDELTGLYTKQAFMHHAEVILRQNPEKRYSLIISDIKDFRNYVNINGKVAANALIRKVGESLRNLQAPGVVMGRYGHDQFISMIEYSAAHKLMENKTFEQSMEKIIPDQSIKTKFGVYQNVDAATPIQTICSRAISALNEVKHQYNRDIAFYTQEMFEHEERERLIEQTMRKAYDEGQFRIYYQPKHDIITGSLVGVEALIRWQHPDLGFLPPDAFIPVFEKNGFVTLADYFVWKTACKDLREWMNMGLGVVPVSVNVSRKDFDYRDETSDYISRILDPVIDCGIDPSLLHIEVTESVFSYELEEISAKLKACRKKGFRVDLDDFGSGFSSLTAVAGLPLDVLKLDRSFIRELQDPKKERVLRVCVNLAKSLGLKTVAEGVETKEELDILRGMGCDMVQGYYYAKPMPKDEFTKYLGKYNYKFEID